MRKFGQIGITLFKNEQYQRSSMPRPAPHKIYAVAQNVERYVYFGQSMVDPSLLVKCGNATTGIKEDDCQNDVGTRIQGGGFPHVPKMAVSNL